MLPFHDGGFYLNIFNCLRIYGQRIFRKYCEISKLALADTALEMVRLGDVDRAGIRFGLHSDMPMAPGSPLVLMHAAVNRINFANEVAGPKQRVSPLAALKG